ncbi:MAG: molybdopterin-binding protein [Thermodesulforhabdaceae bacterium]
MQTTGSMLKPAVVTVGNEIIWGERPDDNRLWMLNELRLQGLSANIAVSLPDDEEIIGQWIGELKAYQCSPIFVSGGIGGTHDDRTRQGVAIALGKQLIKHEECFRILAEKYGSRFTEQRQRMAWLPEGSSLIPNPIGAPGFMVDNIFCFPGFPEMLKPMFQWVFHEILAKNLARAPLVTKEWLLPISEGEIGELIENFARQHPEAYIGLYPHIIKGTKQQVTVRLRYPRERQDIPDTLDRLINSMGLRT